jgi:N-acetylneuraminate synthase
VIAEIGGNFTTFEQARRLIDEAALCGVDAIKLQTYRADTIASRRAMFDMENTGVVSQYELFKQYEIDEALHRQTFRYAGDQGLDWFSTPSHDTDADMLERLGVGAYKIGSDDAVNIPFLKHVARKGRPVILSTGMCTLEEVKESVSAIRGEGNERIVLLHAVTSYPTHPEHVNLSAMESLMREFPTLDVGYSDHTLGPVASICAAALGARVIEKHFTCDKTAEGPDHMHSADPPEMRFIVKSIREFELMRGTGVKAPAESERTTRINNRKSLVLARPVKSGEILTAEHLAVKRPGTGIAPKHYDEVVGRAVRQDLDSDDILRWEHLR